MLSVSRVALLSVSMLTASLAEAAVVIDFESFANSGTGADFYPSPFQVDGYQFSGNLVGNDYLIQQTGSPNFAGSTALSPFRGETHTFRRIDGQPFGLVSFDYSESFTSLGAGTVTFQGNFATGGSISQDVTSDGVFGFEKANFAGFDDLSSVVFTYPGTNEVRFQLDNIEVEAEVIPEPASLIVWGGLLCFGMGVARRRRRD